MKQLPNRTPENLPEPLLHKESELIPRAPVEHVLAVHDVLIEARSDFEAVAAWLAHYQARAKTWRTYRKETNRLLLWCADRGLSLHGLKVEHIRQFRGFLADPQPAERWISATKWPFGHAQWRPFAAPLSLASQAQSFVILGNLFGWLVDTGYLKRNVFRVARATPKAKKSARITRYLAIGDLNFVDAALNTLPDTTPAQARARIRARFLIDLYYTTGIRLFEATRADMGDISRDQDGTWVFSVKGKGWNDGDSLVDIPVSDDLLASLQKYRIAFGLPALPSINETTPLVLAADRRACQDTVYKIIKGIFYEAADIALAKGNRESAGRLRKASTHWLRHSTLSHLLDAGASLVAVKELARHTSIKTTGQYLHKEKRDRFDEILTRVRTPGQLSRQSGDDAPFESEL